MSAKVKMTEPSGFDGQTAGRPSLLKRELICCANAGKHRSLERKTGMWASAYSEKGDAWFTYQCHNTFAALRTNAANVIQGVMPSSFAQVARFVTKALGIESLVLLV